MRYVCVSDTHGQHEALTDDFAVPTGDVLVHAGDMTARDRIWEHFAFLDWFAAHPHPLKVLIAGNHDGCWASAALGPSLLREASLGGIRYDEGGGMALDAPGGRRLRAWGSPWTPEFKDWHFMYERGGARAERLWGELPSDLDLLVTHGPPRGVLDRTSDGRRAGCEVLAQHLHEMHTPPRLHVFGHIHEGGGGVQHGRSISVNASVIDDRYRVVRGPVVVDL